ncbi:MAG: MptD family putative ECF transporter S component [Coriobacteriales bacterium]|nr:MptD family putative ECF transporter S component [Coriobacteriales bacterium]
MSSAEISKRLNGRDLINIGIYTAIYFVVVMALAMTGLIPICLILLSSMIAVVGGIPFMLFLTKVKKPGMILIMSVIMGIIMFVTGMTWMPIPVSIVTGLIAEFVYWRGNYSSIKSAILTTGVFPLWACGNYLPLFLQREQYFADRASYGEEYAAQVMQLTPDWMFIVLVVATFVCGIIGGLIGKALLKKHFEKAGIA